MIPTLEAQVREAAARCLCVPPATIDRDTPLTRYGLDSLKAIELAAALSVIAGRELPNETLLDHTTVRALIAHIDAPDVAVAYGPPVERMLADCVLPDDVRPQAVDAAGEGTLLLTGATGFLGVHVLAALLRDTRHEVVCIVRARSDSEAWARVEAALHSAAGVALPHSRVRAIAGDIEKPSLGLTGEAYLRLCSGVARILHCAAAVDWSQRYDGLRSANVLGTVELLRLASRSRRKAFHFVSSMSACYSTRGPQRVGDGALGAAEPHGIHLGYAQTKWVGEALVREAGRRGLEVAVYRPDLIAGHSETGFANTGDFLARLIKGCIELGTAPDLAWRIDACPVDFVAAALARFAVNAPAGGDAIHLVNPRSGRWLEAVLWMNLRGYRMRVVPYAQWVKEVEVHARASAHPLFPLRGFLLNRPVGEGGPYLPELYAEPHLARVDSHRSRARLRELGLECAGLGPRLLQTWFDGYVGSGFLPAAPALATLPVGARELDSALQALLRTHFCDTRLALTTLDAFRLADDASILGTLAAWHSGSGLELLGYRADFLTGSGARRSLDLVIKPRPNDDALYAVACEVASLCNRRLGAAFAAHWRRTPFAGTAVRERWVHAGDTAAMRDHAPGAYGMLEVGGTGALVLEHVRGVTLDDAVTAPDCWRAEHIEAALAGIARVHAAWYGCERELAAESRLGPVLDAAAVRESAELWFELAEHAAPWFAAWAGAAGARLLRKLAAGAAERALALERHPRCLIHNDFNPRNVGMRTLAGKPSLLAFDWELATLGGPQRDAAELLCFVLRPDTPRDVLLGHIESHRRALARAAGSTIDGDAWIEGFRLALHDFGVQRLTTYVVAHRLRTREFLPRVVQTWMHLTGALEARSLPPTRAAAGV